MKKFIILTVLISLFISAFAVDTLKVYTNNVLGNKPVNAFGVDVGWALRAAIRGQEDYLTRLNLLDGYWSTVLDAPDTQYTRIVKESGISGMRFFLDLGWDKGNIEFLKYVAYDTQWAYRSHDWRGWLGPTEAVRETSADWTLRDSLLLAIEIYDPDTSTFDTLLLVYGDSITSEQQAIIDSAYSTKYIYSRRWIWHDPASSDSLILPSHYPTDRTLAHILECIDSIGASPELVIFGIMDIYFKDCDTSDTISPHFYDYARDLIEYLFSDTGVYASFRKNVDSVDSFTFSDWHITLGNDWENIFWAGGWNPDSGDLPGYSELLCDPWAVIDTHTGDTIDSGPDSLRWSPYYPDTSEIPDLDDWGDDFRRRKEVRIRAQGHAMMRRVRAFSNCLEDFGVRDKIKLGHYFGMGSVIEKDNLYSSLDTLEKHDGYDTTYIYMQSHELIYYLFRYGATNMADSGYVDYGATHTYAQTLPWDLVYSTDSLKNFLKDTCCSVSDDTLYKYLYPKGASIWRAKRKHTIMQEYLADSFSVNPDYKIGAVEWTFAFSRSMLCGIGSSSYLNWFIKQMVSPNPSYPKLEMARNHGITNGDVGMLYGQPKDAEWKFFFQCDSIDSIYRSAVAHVFHLYKSHLGNKIINSELTAISDSTWDYEGLKTLSNSCADTREVFLPDSNLSYFDAIASIDDSGNCKILVTNRSLDSEKCIAIDIFDLVPLQYKDTVKIRTVMVDDSIWSIYLNHTLCKNVEDRKFQAPSTFGGAYLKGPASAWIPYYSVPCGDCGSCDSCDSIIKNLNYYSPDGRMVYPIISKDTTYIRSGDSTFTICLNKFSVSSVEIHPNFKTLVLKTGWNMISLPLDTNVTIRTIFPTSIAPDSIIKIDEDDTFWNIIKFDPDRTDWMFQFKNAKNDTVAPKDGFLIYCKKDTTLTFSSNFASNYTDSSELGWNLTGSVECLRVTDDLVMSDSAASKIIQPFYIFDTEDKLYYESQNFYPFAGHWMFTTDEISFGLNCPADSSKTFSEPEDFSGFSSLNFILPSDTFTIEFGYTSAANIYYDKYDVTLPFLTPAFDPDSDFSAFFYSESPIKTRMKKSIIYEKENWASLWNFKLTGLDSFKTHTNIGFYGLSLLVNQSGNLKGIRYLSGDDSFYISAGSYRIRYCNPLKPLIAIRIGIDDADFYLMNVAPQIPEDEDWDGWDGIFSTYLIPIPNPKSDSTFDIEVVAFTDFDYYNKFELRAIDYQDFGIAAINNGNIAIFYEDSLKNVLYAVTDDGDTITDMLMDRDNWVFVSDDSGYVEFKILGSWLLGSGDPNGGYVIFDRPPAIYEDNSFAKATLKHYFTPTQQWTTVTTVHGRIENSPACGLVPSNDPNNPNDTVTVRLYWNHGIVLDQIAVSPHNAPSVNYTNTDCQLQIALDNNQNNVLDSLLALDVSYVSLDSGEVLTLKFDDAVADTPNSGHDRVWYFRTYGKLPQGQYEGSSKLTAKTENETAFYTFSGGIVKSEYFLRLFDITGHELNSGKIIDINKYPQGIYLISDGLRTKKIIWIK